MDREGFRNRMKQYKEARGQNPQLKYWEWKQKYDSAPQPDEMPSTSQPDSQSNSSNQLSNRAHRWDESNTRINREPYDSPYEDARYHDYRKPRFELRKGNVHYANPNVLKWMGRIGKVMRCGSVLGEVVQNLFPSEEAESYSRLQLQMHNTNKALLDDSPKMYKDGGEVGDNKAIPTQEEYIAEQIAAKKATALSNFRSVTEPVLPIINGQPNVNSCIYTALNMYGRQYATPGNWTFYDDPGKHGFKQKELSKAQPSDLIQVFDKNKPYHMMMLDGYDEQGHPLYNYSRGMKGDSSDIVKAKTNFPNTKKLAYEFVGTPADSTQWKNEYKKLYGYVDGGEVEGDFLKQFGNQVSYKPQETSWWSDIKNWWNDATGMKNYAYGNCATTPSGKHTKECAHYSNSVLRGQGYKNIVGDAWTRAAHSGMKKIISGYDGLTKPAKWDEDDAHEYLQAAAKNFTNKVDTMSLNPYDVIGLYYPDSPNTKKAFEQGKWGETQTHTGHIAIGKDGTHYVVHNVDGHLKMNKLADMITGDYEYLPVSAYRPKK